MTPSPSLLAACRPFLEAATWPPLVDFLLDSRANAADVAVLFAGTPPAHTDGLPREWLVTWLHYSGQESQAKAVQKVEMGGWRSIEAQQGPYRLGFWITGAPMIAIVRPHGGVAGADPPRLAWRWQDSSDQHHGVCDWLTHAQQAAEAALDLPGKAIRTLKRAVLALPWASEVRVEHSVTLTPEQWRVATCGPDNTALYRKLGFRPSRENGVWVWASHTEAQPGDLDIFRPKTERTIRQTLDATLLIWPEKPREESYPHLDAGPVGDWRGR